MTFRVGQKVICIKRGPWSLGAQGPAFGEAVTIRGFSKIDGLLLEEWPSRHFYSDLTPIGYSPDRFRPVIERKTSIELFTAMLKPSKVEA